MRRWVLTEALEEEEKAVERQRQGEYSRARRQYEQKYKARLENEGFRHRKNMGAREISTYGQRV